VVSASIEPRNGQAVPKEQAAALRAVPRDSRLVAYVAAAMDIGPELLAALGRTLEPVLKINLPKKAAETVARVLGWVSDTHTLYTRI
jgi:hypothetical protein